MRPERAHTVAASSAIGLLAYARARAIALDGVLEGAGLTAAALAGAEARISRAAHDRLWALLVQASGDPDFGLHVAEHMTLETFGVVGHLVARSLTFGQALDRVVAYSRTLHDAARVELEHIGDRLTVYPSCRGLTHEVPRHVAECAAASVVVLGRLVTRTPLRPLAVRFRHAAPAAITEHTRIFQVAPTFGAPETEVHLPRACANLAIPDAPGAGTYLDGYARAVIAALPPDDDLVAAIERLVATSIARGIPDLEAIAVHMAMTTRALQRRLAELETSYPVVVDRVRQRYAERYLADDRLPLADVAFLVGYAEVGNFLRAFRRWTGETPAAYRAARAAA
ncbi:MAG: AraC family transcriptional regulator [Deltaproteobacteria bacterium]|nr:AraC family transcriptional regulator [Deltaproteobacteria bacterium]